MLLFIMQERTYSKTPVDMIETKIFVGILDLLGVSKGNHENVRSFWSDGPLLRPVLKATMSVNRFESVRCYLRFDATDTREERRARDKFAPFRDIWNFLRVNAKKITNHQQKFASTNNSFHLVVVSHFFDTCHPN